MTQLNQMFDYADMHNGKVYIVSGDATTNEGTLKEYKGAKTAYALNRAITKARKDGRWAKAKCIWNTCVYSD